MPKQMGELMIDHRASPGLPADVAQQFGIDPALAGEGKLFEAATLTCSHCKAVVIKSPLRTRERHYCAKCSGHYICDYCYAATTAADYSHTPFDKLVDVTMQLAEKGIVLGSPSELLNSPKPGLILPPSTKE